MYPTPNARKRPTDRSRWGAVMSSQLKPGRRGLCAWCEDDAQQDQGDADREGEQGAGHDRVHVRALA